MRLLTVNEFCDRASLSRATAYRMIADGTLPSKRFGRGKGALRIPESALQADPPPEPSRPRRTRGPAIPDMVSEGISRMRPETRAKIRPVTC